jgi:hypothetical protein
MRRMSIALVMLGCVLSSAVTVLGQSAPSAPSVTVPRLIHVAGVFQPVDGQPPNGVEVAIVSIYADPDGGLPVWQERQSVTVEKSGRFALLLGASDPNGIPAAVFGAGQAQWMSLLFERGGEAEQQRVRIASVPYALKASDAETLGGLPASAYLRAPAAERAGVVVERESSSAAMPTDPSVTSAVTSAVVQPGTTNFLAKYVNGTDVGNSAVYEAGGSVGIGTTTPLDAMHVRFNNTIGSMTGLAVQNLGNTSASYSGMLFYDQNGALGQFQGFNNSTHEYRINNVASSGSINFMQASKSRFLVAPNGNIGIGTTSPVALLEVSNAVPGNTVPANMWMTSYTNFLGPYYMARRARGTPAAPTAVQNGDGLAGLYGQGYGTTTFGPAFTGGMTVQAAQNWTDAAQGTALTFTTTAINANIPTTRMTLDATGNLGIGTTTTPAAGILEVSNAGHTATFANILGSSFTGSNSAGTLFTGRKARGTSAAPTAVQNGDHLAAFNGQGYGASAFGGTRGGMYVRAAENWTNTAQGTLLHFGTTAIGTNTEVRRMTVDPFGNVGIGTLTPEATLDMVKESGAGPLEIALTRYAGTSSSGEPNIVLRTARGTLAAPSALLAGDELGGWSAGGYGATDFGNGGVGMGGFAAENWTDTAQGAGLMIAATPLGSNEGEVNMVIMPGGNVGIGTFTDFPTIADKLQVFGDIRVGVTGTDGCVKNFAGTGIAGTCSSDRRYKKDITPFTPVLNKLTALQPVHYFWRSTDFPQHHFGDGRAYGLIAQDVEAVLPELVVTGDDGFKAVDYTKLPLLTIQAVKELQAENESLKQRLTELERLIVEMRATSSGR